MPGRCALESAVLLYIGQFMISSWKNFAALTQTLKQGWGWEDPDISVGPLINENAVHEMEVHVQNAIDQGARVVIGKA